MMLVIIIIIIMIASSRAPACHPPTPHPLLILPCPLPCCLQETGEDRTCGQFFYMVTVIWMMIIGMVIMGLLSVPLSIIASAIGLVCCPCIVILRVCMGNRS